MSLINNDENITISTEEEAFSLQEISLWPKIIH